MENTILSSIYYPTERALQLAERYQRVGQSHIGQMCKDDMINDLAVFGSFVVIISLAVDNA